MLTTMKLLPCLKARRCLGCRRTFASCLSVGKASWELVFAWGHIFPRSCQGWEFLCARWQCGWRLLVRANREARPPKSSSASCGTQTFLDWRTGRTQVPASAPSLLGSVWTRTCQFFCEYCSWTQPRQVSLSLGNSGASYKSITCFSSLVTACFWVVDRFCSLASAISLDNIPS